MSDNPDLPSTWSTTENVEWAAKVPGVGWSSPIIWDGKVFVTSAMSEAPMKQPSLGVDFSNDYVAELQALNIPGEEVERRVTARENELPNEIELSYGLFSYDLESGNLLWATRFHEGRPPVGRHRKNSYTSETPVTDGRAIYVYVAFQGLYAFDFDGNQLWAKRLSPHQVYLDFGAGSSPALHGSKLFILNDNEEQSFIAAYDKNTGKQLWYTPRRGLGSGMGRKSGWSTPFVWENDLRTEIVTTGQGGVRSYGLDGELLWHLTGMSTLVIPTPLTEHGLLYINSGYVADQNRPVYAIRPGASGDITLGEGTTSNDYIVWSHPQLGSYNPSSLVYGDYHYTLLDRGILMCYDARTGQEVYPRQRITAGTLFTASPWAYNGKIFALSEDGDTFVIQAGPEFAVLGRNSLDEMTLATPAVANGSLILRTGTKLYRIATGG